MRIICSIVCFVAICCFANAQPINYQGRLSDKSGTNVNGTKNFSLRIFDAKEDGKQTYEENVGAVVIKEGAYSFGFGEAGQSILDFSESLIVEEDGKQIFDFTLSKTPVAESLSIQAGEFTWSEKTGSSDSDNLLVQYDKNNKSAKIIFLNSSPGKDAALKFDYRVEENGIMAGLASSPSSWLELAVGGETLSPRERLVAVPFALTAKQLSEPLEIPLLVESYSANSGYIGNTFEKNKKRDVTLFLQKTREGRELHFRNANGSSRYIYIPKGLKKLTIRIYPLSTENLYKESIYKYLTYGILGGVDQDKLIFKENLKVNGSYSKFNETEWINPIPGLYPIFFLVKDFGWHGEAGASHGGALSYINIELGVVIAGQHH